MEKVIIICLIAVVVLMFASVAMVATYKEGPLARILPLTLLKQTENPLARDTGETRSTEMHSAKSGPSEE
jgi:hypothetical protein